MTLQRMDNVGIVVDDLDAAIAFFTELGMEVEGTADIEGIWADQTVGLDGIQCEIANYENVYRSGGRPHVAGLGVQSGAGRHGDEGAFGVGAEDVAGG